MKSRLFMSFLATVALLTPHAITFAQEPLTLSKLESLLRVRAPDSTIAAEVKQRGLAFAVSKETVQRLRGAGAGKQTLAALEDAIPVLDDAKNEIPALLAAIYTDLDQGEVTKASVRMTSKVAGNTQVLDGLCRPFTYKAHYIVAMTERPGKRVEVRVRSLFAPLEEHADILEFVRQDGGFLLDGVQHEPDSWLAPTKASAVDTARKFVFAATAGRKDVVETLSAPGLDIRGLMQPECTELLSKAKDLSSPRVELINYKGLKPVVGFGGFGGWSGRAIQVDTVGEKDLVVRFQAPCEISVISARGGGRSPQPVAAEAPGLEEMTLGRFGLRPPGVPKDTSAVAPGQPSVSEPAAASASPSGSAHVSPPRFVPVQGLPDILANHIEAMGGAERLRGVRSVRAQGRIVANGKDFKFQTEMMRPNLVRSEISGERAMVQLFDGSAGWKIEPGRQAKRLDREDEALFAADGEIAGPLFESESKGIVVRLLPAGDRSGFRLSVALPAGLQYVITLDERFLLVTRERRKKNFLMSTDIEDSYLDYRTVAGLAMPYRIVSRYTTRLGKTESVQTQTMEVDSYEVDSPLEASRFKVVK